MTRMKISILIQSSPYRSRACETALEFAKAAVQQGHSIYRVFLYKDAVLLGNRFMESPSDERNVQKEWQTFITDQSQTVAICIASGQRRGIVDGDSGNSIASGFEISGLGQFVEATLESDRVVSF